MSSFDGKKITEESIKEGPILTASVGILVTLDYVFLYDEEQVRKQGAEQDNKQDKNKSMNKTKNKSKNIWLS